jgi:hypothetical protein
MDVVNSTARLGAVCTIGDHAGIPH